MFDISQKHQVNIRGRGNITLSPGDYVTGGGEGHVYRKGKTAIKIWDDPTDAQQRRIPERLERLRQLPDTYIVVPGALVSLKGNVVGYEMSWKEGWGLPLAFTNDWRQQNGFTDVKALEFLVRMQTVVIQAHKFNIIMGDANEFNVLGEGTSPTYIDVDSWVPEGFTGDKVLPSIFDHHSPAFTKDADWFAWAVVGFQLLIGIHPYRGSHPNFPKNDLVGRMKNNVSVFDPAVKTPPTARPMSLIPSDLRDWFIQVFQHGHRQAPPQFSYHVTPAGIPVAVVLPTSGRVTLDELYTFTAPVAKTAGPGLLMLSDGSLIDIHTGRKFGAAPDTSHVCSVLPSGLVIAAPVTEGILSYYIVSIVARIAMDAGLQVQSMWAADNRLFAVMSDGITELMPREMIRDTKLLPGRRWALNANATTFGDGIAVYNALGASHLVVPHGAGVSFLRCTALDGLTPLGMLCRGRVAVLKAATAAGDYKHILLVFTEDFRGVMVTTEDADTADLTEVITDSGVIAKIRQDGKLELTKPAVGITPIVSDFPSGARLFCGPSGVYAVLGDKMYKVNLK